jgi:DNA-binding LacI/PurR family transcriptional regulator
MGRATLALAAVGLTQTEVALAAGVSQKTVSAVLRGESGRASAETRRRIIGAIAGLAGIASAAQVEAAMLVAGSER